MTALPEEFVTASKFAIVVVKIPLVNVSVPPMLTAPPELAPALLLRVRLLNVEAGIVCALLPSKVTVPPQVLPEGTGVALVFCVLMTPALVTLVRVNVFVAIFRVPPVVVFRVVAAIFPPAVWIPLVLPIVKVAYVGVA